MDAWCYRASDHLRDAPAAVGASRLPTARLITGSADPEFKKGSPGTRRGRQAKAAAQNTAHLPGSSATPASEEAARQQSQRQLGVSRRPSRRRAIEDRGVSLRATLRLTSGGVSSPLPVRIVIHQWNFLSVCRAAARR